MKISFSVLDNHLQNCIKEKKFPGGVCWVGNDKETFFFKQYGYAQITGEKIKIEKDTLFDLASITKPIATALSIMILCEQRRLRLNDTIKKFLGEFKNKKNGKITIKELLTHTSGIPAWFPTYLIEKKNRTEFLAKTNTGRTAVIYSCLGYIILGEIIKSVTGSRLDDFCAINIFKKIGLNNTGFGIIAKGKTIAATEYGNEHEKTMAQQYGDISKIRWREHLIKGKVHDGNAFYSYNGVSGNAGLFSNARDLMKISRAYCAGEIVKLSTVRAMTKDHTGDREKRGLGWVINPYSGLLSPNAFGHTGFTGTMLLIDPKPNLIIILLTNAVHPKVKLGVMDKVRRKVVQTISDCLA